MNLSTFIHSEKERHGMRSMKIEPVASIVPCYTPSGKRVALNTRHQGLPIGTVLYTEAQMRQLGEACAAVCERTPKMQAYGNNRAVQDECAAAIRKLIKEMLPSAELAKQEKA